MLIKCLRIQNFRCYDDLEVCFDRQMTVLVGLNGRGKTAILDGIELCLSGLDGEAFALQNGDIRNFPVRKNKKIVGMEQKSPVVLTADMGNLQIVRSMENKNCATLTTMLGTCHREKFINVFAYYDTGRMGVEAHLFGGTMGSMRKHFPVLRTAVNMGLRYYGAVLDYNPRLHSFVIRDKLDGEQLFSVASDGARSIIGMVGSLALEIAKANPGMGVECLKKTPGIVLIDEIDLHLHPSWEQRILPELQRIFPKIQFIVTTHSPQVLSTVRPEQIRILDDKACKVMQPEFSLGAESHQLLQDIQHVESRPASLPVVKNLKRYLALIARDEYESAEALKLRKKLDEWAGKYDPVLVKTDMDIRLRKMRCRNEKNQETKN